VQEGVELLQLVIVSQLQHMQEIEIMILWHRPPLCSLYYDPGVPEVVASTLLFCVV
jgi:hypothetical protein